MYKQQKYFDLSRLMRYFVLAFILVLLFASIAIAAIPGESAPERQANEGSGPHPELILRGVNLINGEGAPVRGPVDIVVKKSV